MDLTAPFLHHIETTARSWPTCDRCTRRLQRLFRVEVLGLLGREKPNKLGLKCRAVVEVECHGERQEFTLDYPAWWSEALFHDALGQTVAFVQLGDGRYGVGKMRMPDRSDVLPMATK